MRPYEMVVVLRADLSEEDLSGQIEAIQNWIQRNKGEIVEAKHWGRRRLAFPIKKLRDGYYIFYRLSLPADAPAELERSLRFSENVLRYLIVRQGE